MSKRKSGERRERWFPRQRPREEWEHVYVRSNGARYVDVKELLADDKVKDMIAEFAKVDLKSLHRNRAEGRGPDGGDR